MGWKIVGRKTWSKGYGLTSKDGRPVRDARIVVTETFNTEAPAHRRFTATICGWQNWKIAEWLPGERSSLGSDSPVPAWERFTQMHDKAEHIRDRILAGDEAVFQEPNAFLVF